MNNGYPIIICIEGVDGVGKETVCKALYNKFMSLGKTLLISLPDYSLPSGQLIYDILHDDNCEWFNSAGPKFKSALWTINRFHAYRRYELEDPDNIPYEFIIMDRSYFSNLIYQASEYFKLANMDDSIQKNEFQFYNNVIDYMKSQYEIEYNKSFLRNIPFDNFHIYYLCNDKNDTQLKQRGGDLDNYEKDSSYLENCNNFIHYLYHHKPDIFKYDSVVDEPYTEGIYGFYLQPLKMITVYHKNTTDEINHEIVRVTNNIMMNIIKSMIEGTIYLGV